MVDAPRTLPDLDALDPAAMKVMIVDQHAVIEHLKLIIAKLRRMQFGRRSEKADRQIEQFELQLEVLEASRVEPVQEPVSTPTPKARTHPLPGSALSPARASAARSSHLSARTQGLSGVRRHAEEAGRRRFRDAGVYSRQLCGPPSRSPEAELRTLCMRGAGARAHPACRSRARRSGTAGSRSHCEVRGSFALVPSVADVCPRRRRSALPDFLTKWVGEASHLLEPLVEVLRRYVMNTDKLHGDDTPLPVLAPGNGRTKTGRFWTYVRDSRPAGDIAPPAVWFTYSPDRKGEHPQQHLASFRGILQADAYSGFNKLYEDGSIQEAPCKAAHIRRKFYDLMEGRCDRSPIATGSC